MSRPSEILMDIKSVKAWLTEADYVPVVRCKDCKHWNPNGIGICKLHDIRPTPLMMDNWFCADGERRDDGQIQQSN